jgi:hypothetical protein
MSKLSLSPLAGRWLGEGQPHAERWSKFPPLTLTLSP